MTATVLQRLAAAVLLLAVAGGTLERHSPAAEHDTVETWSAIHRAEQPCPRRAHLDAAQVETHPPCTACLRRLQGRAGLPQLTAAVAPPPGGLRAARLATTWQPSPAPYRISVPRAPPLV